MRTGSSIAGPAAAPNRCNPPREVVVTVPDDGRRMLGGLLDASHTCSLDDLPKLVHRHAAAGLEDPLIYLVDRRQEVLLALGGDRAGGGQVPAELPIDATLAGRAFRNVEIAQARMGTAEDVPVVGEGGAIGTERHRLWVPLLDGTERVGVLGVVVRAIDEAVLATARQLASLVALLVVSKRPHSDTYARLTRIKPMSLAAEVQWTLLPPLTFANEAVAISAALEPAYEIAGDAFDYAIAGPMVSLSIFDAMGHDLQAGLTASIAMGACRNSRRQGADPVEVSEAIETAVGEQFGETRFATGILADLDVRTGLLRWVNRGHPPPLLIRQGRWITALACPPAPPMGLGLGITSVLCQAQLEPGDRLLLYTDGVTEAHGPGEEQFGLDRFAEFVIRREADGLPAPETLRRLVRAILAHHDGKLHDDATVLLAEWRSGSDRRLTL
jgi:serine phosphatase RsbU (regulator of sigma subunit)